MALQELESTIKMLMRLWADEKNAQEKSLNKIRYSGPVLGPDEYEAMLSAVFGNWWSGGKFTIEAEKKLAKMSNRNHALLVNSGSSANLILMEAMRHLYFKEGDGVLTLACGFPTTVNAIIKSGLTPVFVDIDLNTLNFDPDSLESLIKSNPHVKGLFLPHTLGYKSDINKLLDVARKYDLMVVFDACDAYGTVYEGNPIQHYGKAATLSFYVAHHITMGEGGAIVTNDDDLIRVMRGLRNWGKYCSSDHCCIRSVNPEAFCSNTRLTLDSPIPNDYPVSYIYEWVGYNLKPLELQSAILTKQMDRLPDFSERRRNNYKILHDYFSTLKHIKIWDIDSEVSPFVFPLLISKDAPFIRKHLIDYMKRNNVETRVIFAGNMTKHPAYYKNKNYTQIGSLDNSDALLERGLMLGVSHVNDQETTYKIVDILKKFFKKY